MPPASCTAPPPRSAPAGAGMGQVAGYTAADYLIQHASRERRYARVPASTWDALLSHIRDPDDAARLADSAKNRLLYRYAIPLYRHAADAGDRHAAMQLAGLLAERGDLDGPAPARPGRRRRRVRRRAAGRSAGRPRRPGRTARPGQRRRRVRRRAAGRAAGRPRRPGRTARPGRRRRRVRRRAAGRAAGRPRRPGRGRADLRARADAGDEVRRRAAGRSAGRPRRPGRSCAPGPTPETGTPPSCWPTAATWTGPSRSCAPGPTPTRTPPGGWPDCWPSAATWTGCAP